MTKNEIIRMAMQVGCTANEARAWEITLTSFAALVEARAAVAERKACVEACKEQRLLLVEDEAKYASLGIAMCVDAIKTRGIK